MAEIISAAVTVCDKLFKKLYVHTAAKLALLSDMLAHSVHLLSAVNMTLKCFKPPQKKYQRSQVKKRFLHTFPLRGVVQAMSMLALSMRIILVKHRTIIRHSDWHIVILFTKKVQS